MEDAESTMRAACPDLSVQVGTLALANPVMPASGCFGTELADVVPVQRLGALVTKTIFSEVRGGNPAHRLAETPHGMLNSVGIPSPGMNRFITHVLPVYRRCGPPVVVSIGGLTGDEYVRAVDQLEAEEFAAIELNVSCPNLEKGGLEIGADPRLVEDLTRRITARTSRPVIVKLTPNVTAVATIARAAEDGGAVAVTVANTFVGLAVDRRSRRPVLGTTTGGMSGAAVKPLVMRLVWEISKRVSIPIVACGGVMSAADVVEFMLAGATAVQVGTGTFARPNLMIRILDDLPVLLDEMRVTSVRQLRGQLQVR